MILTMRRAWSVGVVLAAVATSPAWAEEPAEPLPADAAAVVGEAVITRTTFNLWFAAAAKTAKPDRNAEYRMLVREVMQFLIQSEWVQGEANRQGIRVSERRVRRALERQKDQAFPTERAYRRWLQKSGMTHEMIMFRVRLNVLQRRLTAHVTRDIRPTRDPRVRARRQQRAIERFIADFRARWEGDTVCAPGYVVEECGGN
jgi:hypothetical protein